jgi:surface polysaccharide O-acyltransferase-like enzyme
MILVVLVHANFYRTNSVSAWWPGGYWAPALYGFAVPTFFMISGFLLALRDPLEAPFPTRTFVRKKLVNLLIPFWAWTAIMMGVSSLVESEPTALWRYFFFGATGFWQLYYVFSLLQLFALYILLRSRLQGRGLHFIVVLSVLVTALTFTWSSLSLKGAGPEEDFIDDLLSRIGFTWSGFFFIGVWLGRKPEVLERLARHLLPLALVTLALYLLPFLEIRHWDQLYGRTPSRVQILIGGLPYQILMALTLLALSCRLDRTRAGKKILRPLTWLGADSLGIYVCHTAFLMAATYLVFQWDLDATGWGSVPAMAVITFFSSWGLVRLMRLRPMRWPAFFLFGRRLVEQR